MDGFDQTVNVKVIMATNRADTLDPALLRPGRLDRKIEFPLPDRRQKRLVFQVILGMHYIIIYYHTIHTVLFSSEGAVLMFLVIFYSCFVFFFVFFFLCLGGEGFDWLLLLCASLSFYFVLDYIVQVCTAKMNLGDEVDLEDYVSRPDKISAAEVS